MCERVCGQATTERIDYFDIAKGIAIIAIIFGHTGFYPWIWYTFHVPLFLLISGYFFKYKKGTLQRKIIRLLKPYCLTVILCMVISILISHNHSPLYWLEAGLFGSASATHSTFMGIMFPHIGAIWFLLALGWSFSFLSLCLKLKMRLLSMYVVAIVLLLSAVLTSIDNCFPLSFQAGCSSFLFVLIGYHIKQFSKQYNNKYLLYICLIVWIVSLYFSWSKNHMSIAVSQFPNPIINILGSLAGSYIVLKLSQRIDSKRVLIVRGGGKIFRKIFYCNFMFSFNSSKHDGESDL